MIRILRNGTIGLAILLVTSLSFSGCTLGATSTLRVINNSSYTIVIVNARTAGAAEWGENRLSGDLASGSSVDISLSPGTYDIRAVSSELGFAERFNLPFDANGGFEWTLFDKKNGVGVDSKLDESIAEFSLDLLFN